MKATGTLQAGTGLWEHPNTDATNSSGFTGLPGGYRFSNGPFLDIGSDGYWWSSTQNSSTDAWYRFLNFENPNSDRDPDTKTTGFSVRCVMD